MFALKGLTLAAAFVMVLAACSDETRGEIADAVTEGVSTSVEGTEPGSEAPDTEGPDIELPASDIEAQEPEPAAEDEGLPGEAIALLLLIGGLGLVILVLVGRRRSEPVAQPVTAAPRPPSSSEKEWSDQARIAYTDARWILDNADGEVATWRATEGDDGLSDTSRLGMVSRSLDERISRTMDEVYRLEAAAVTRDQRDAARSVGAALKSVQSAFETRVAAQRDSLVTASGQSSERAEAESDASARLRQARRSLETTLDRLTMSV